MTNEEVAATNISIKYLDTEIHELFQAKGTDWIDLPVSCVVPVSHNMKVTDDDRFWERENIREKSKAIKVYFGIAMELPEGYEAIIRPRGSLFKNHGLIFTSSGVIDESFNGDSDEWFGTFYTTTSTMLVKGERICQFRIQEKQPRINFESVETLANEGRGGYGSTGRV